tara:strand:+ start:192 stop:458 length:267 start_codon:yes stop_codon:yes gene_type:complete
MKNIIICSFVILFAINLNAAETPCSQYKKFFPELLKYNECMAKLKTEGKLQKKDGKSVSIIKSKSKSIKDKFDKLNNTSTLMDIIKKK